MNERYDQAAAQLDADAQKYVGGPVPVGMKAPRITSLREQEVELKETRNGS